MFERGYKGPVYSDGIYLVDGEGERITRGPTLRRRTHDCVPEPRPGIEDAPTLLVATPSPLRQPMLVRA